MILGYWLGSCSQKWHFQNMFPGLCGSFFGFIHWHGTTFKDLWASKHIIHDYMPMFQLTLWSLGMLFLDLNLPHFPAAWLTVCLLTHTLDEPIRDAKWSGQQETGPNTWADSRSNIAHQLAHGTAYDTVPNDAVVRCNFRTGWSVKLTRLVFI